MVPQSGASHDVLHLKTPRYVTRLFVRVTPRNSRLLFFSAPSHGVQASARCLLLILFSVCVHVCVTVLRCYHTVCSLSALLPLGISVFLTALLSSNNLPPALHKSDKTPNNNSGCNCICMWYCETCGHGKTACVRGFASSCAFCCSVRAHLRAGLFIRSVGRCVFCWHCMVQSLRLALINSIRGPPRLCAADWLHAWREASA